MASSTGKIAGLNLLQRGEQPGDIVRSAPMHQVQVEGGHRSAVKNACHHAHHDILDMPFREQPEHLVAADERRVRRHRADVPSSQISAVRPIGQVIKHRILLYFDSENSESPAAEWHELIPRATGVVARC